eukprot:COSAG01_NODE_2533_length_7491_cov_236.560741_7_plen_69_part_00
MLVAQLLTRRDVEPQLISFTDWGDSCWRAGGVLTAIDLCGVRSCPEILRRVWQRTASPGLRLSISGYD